MTREDYVSFELAKLLKEKGFQAKCTACYHSDPSHTLELVSGRINYCNPRFSKCKMIPPYNAPTLQMTMKWLRKKRNLHITLPYYIEGFYGFEICDIKKCIVVGHNVESIKYTEPEEACEAAIRYCLENLI